MIVNDFHLTLWGGLQDDQSPDPDSVIETGAELLKNHSSELKITCAKDSTMQSCLESNYPKVSIVQPKKQQQEMGIPC